MQRLVLGVLQLAFERALGTPRLLAQVAREHARKDEEAGAEKERTVEL